MRHLDPAQMKAELPRKANSFAEEYATDLCANDVAAIQLRRRYNPDKKETRALGDHKLDTTSGRTDCTEPPQDS
jgi:hypothetical protein